MKRRGFLRGFAGVCGALVAGKVVAREGVPIIEYVPPVEVEPYGVSVTYANRVLEQDCNGTYADIVARTLRHRQKELLRNVTSHNVLLRGLK